jgi:hypothetical protein
MTTHLISLFLGHGLPSATLARAGRQTSLNFSFSRFRVVGAALVSQSYCSKARSAYCALHAQSCLLDDWSRSLFGRTLAQQPRRDGSIVRPNCLPLPHTSSRRTDVGCFPGPTVAVMVRCSCGCRPRNRRCHAADRRAARGPVDGAAIVIMDHRVWFGGFAWLSYSAATRRTTRGVLYNFPLVGSRAASFAEACRPIDEGCTPEHPA